jgi:hypothetical protein
MLCNNFVHQGCRDFGRVLLIMPVPAIADNIYDGISLERLPVLGGKHTNLRDSFNIVSVHMKNRRTFF